MHLEDILTPYIVTTLRARKLCQVEQHVPEQQGNPTDDVCYGRFQSLTVNYLDEYSPVLY